MTRTAGGRGWRSQLLPHRGWDRDLVEEAGKQAYKANDGKVSEWSCVSNNYHSLSKPEFSQRVEIVH